MGVVDHAITTPRSPILASVARQLLAYLHRRAARDEDQPRLVPFRAE
jgi:hypothetical protein